MERAERPALYAMATDDQTHLLSRPGSIAKGPTTSTTSVELGNLSPYDDGDIGGARTFGYPPPYEAQWQSELDHDPKRPSSFAT